MNEITIEAPTNFKWEPKTSLDKQIICLLSGGVDSSVTAYLLKEAGYDVLGITMKLPLASNPSRSCNNFQDGANIANQLGICHYYLNLNDVFFKYVIEPFQNDYILGNTPSPCVNCNEKIKFGIVWDFLKENFGINNLATGHYAKIYSDNEGFHIARGRDLLRDQSYFLYGIKKENLKYLQFPLEPYSKDEVRNIAEKAGLNIAQKPDSMELCFAGEGDYRSALSSISKKGNIIDTNGNFLKEHKGIENYTIGQRKGLGVSAPYPLYVTDINPITNTVTLGKKEDGLVDYVEAIDLNVIEDNKFAIDYKCYGKIRSNGNPKECKIIQKDNNYVKIQFNELFFKSAPGQKLVLYDENNNIILGGTIIK